MPAAAGLGAPPVHVARVSPSCIPCAYLSGTTLLYHTGTTRIRRNFPYVTSVSFDTYKSCSQGIHLFCKAVVVPTEPGDTSVPRTHVLA